MSPLNPLRRRPQNGAETETEDGAPSGDPSAELAELRRRVAVLELEVQECRQLSKRVAEITDVVAEVLLPVGDRDEERLRAILAQYQSTL